MNKRLIFYHPTMLVDVDFRKGFEIPLNLSTMGYKTTILVGRHSISESTMKLLNNVALFVTGNDLYSAGLRVHLREVSQLLLIMRRERPDTILVLEMWPSVPFLLAACRIWEGLLMALGNRKTRSRFILKMDSDGERFRTGRRRFATRLALMFHSLVVDKVVIESSAGAKKVRRFIPDKSKLTVIPNGYSGRIITPVKYQDVSRLPLILNVARISPEKGQDVLIRSFARLSNEFEGWKVRLVGPVQDEVYYRYLQNLVKSFGLEKKVEFIPEVRGPGLAEQYLMSEVFVMPSRAEGSPIARIEAAAFGLPVLTTTAGGGEDLGHQGGFVVPIDDDMAMGDALRELLRDDRLRMRCSDELQTHILSWDIVTARFLTLMEESS